MHSLLTTYLLGLATLPALALLTWLLYKFANLFYQFFIGLPPIRWFAMAFLIIGTKLISGRDCHMMTTNGRIWYSPNVRFFEDPKIKR